MAAQGTVACTFHGSTFVEIAFAETTLFVDPTFSQVRRGRRVRGETRPCDFVLCTEGGESIDDALDVLEDDEDAVLVGSPAACKLARSELRLERDRTLDLEPWERAKDAAFRVTAIPIAIASPFDEGLASIEDLALGAGRAGMAMGRRGLDMSGRLGAGMGPLGSSLGRLPLVGELSRGRAASALPDLLGAFTGAMGQLGSALPGGGLRGMGIGAPGRGRPGLGWLIEPTDGPSILHLGRGIHAGTDERDLEDVAELCSRDGGSVDAILVDVSRSSVDALVRATRVLEPSFVLLYRSEDAYERGRRRTPQPVSAFAEAIAEDGEDIEVTHLKKGDRFVLGPGEQAADAQARAAKNGPRETTTS